MEEHAGLLRQDEEDDSNGRNIPVTHKFSIEEANLPNVEEERNLPRIADKVPSSAFLVSIIELCERFAYYGLTGPFQNYMQNAYPSTNGIPGALGLGQAGASGLSSFFSLWCYLTPILGAVIADQYWGRYKTIVFFAVVYAFGIFVLFLTSLPTSIVNGYAFAGLVVSMVVIGLGAGGIKSNVSPLIAEQYQQSHDRVVILDNGERVIVDVSLTVQRMYTIFYSCINIGGLSGIFTTVLERQVGFWCAYLLPLVIFLVGLATIVLRRKSYVTTPPKGSVVLHAFQASWIAFRNGYNLDAAKGHGLPWDDAFIEELRDALIACKAFLFFPVFWLCFNQMYNNFISQAATMKLNGIPNDLVQNIDPMLVLVLLPVVDYYVYPTLRRFGFDLRPTKRIVWGFGLVSAAMIYAAILQQIIYTSPPYSVHVLWQTPTFLLLAASEILANVTGLEYAFMQAPSSMKSFIMSLFMLTTAVGSILAAFISPFAVDPLLTWYYAGLGVASLINTACFRVFFMAKAV